VPVTLGRMTPDPSFDADDLPANRYFSQPLPRDAFPDTGMPAADAYELIHLGLRVDGQPSMNLASFVTTWMEPAAEKLISEALSTNHIDHEEYPIAEHAEQICVRMLADLWNAPDVQDAVGVATIGSSEAIMLGLLAHKFSWRAKRNAAPPPTRSSTPRWPTRARCSAPSASSGRRA
jgi:glutamate decarboxylase